MSCQGCGAFDSSRPFVGSLFAPVRLAAKTTRQALLAYVTIAAIARLPVAVLARKIASTVLAYPCLFAFWDVAGRTNAAVLVFRTLVTRDLAVGLGPVAT